MKYLSIIFCFIICLISVLVIIGLEYFIDNFFLIPILESVVIFLSVFSIYKTTNERLLTISIIFALFFLLFENSVYAIAIALNMVEGTGLTIKSVLSWRFLYNFLFVMIYVPLLTRGIKSGDKALYVLFFILGTCLHLGFNLVMQVIS